MARNEWTTVIKTIKGTVLGTVTGGSGFMPGPGTVLDIGGSRFKVVTCIINLATGSSSGGLIDVTVGAA